MTTPNTIKRVNLDNIVVSNINEFGWHAVNVMEDDGQPPWTLLRLAGPFTRPCVRPAPASQAREPDSPFGFRAMPPTNPLPLPWGKELS